MGPAFKELTAFFVANGAAEVSHTDKTYLAHAIGVYTDLKAWGCDEDLARVGLFHSIYGTEIFQGFTLPLSRRGDIRALIGERAERLAYLNCAMNRASFDAQVVRRQAPYPILDRLTGQPVALDRGTFDDLVRVHLCDGLEQVERSQRWDDRRQAFAQMGARLGGVALDAQRRVYARAPQAAA